MTEPGPGLPYCRYLAILVESVVGGQTLGEVASAPDLETCVQMACAAWQTVADKTPDLIGNPRAILIVDIDSGAGVAWLGVRIPTRYYRKRGDLSP